MSRIWRTLSVCCICEYVCKKKMHDNGKGRKESWSKTHRAKDNGPQSTEMLSSLANWTGTIYRYYILLPFVAIELFHEIKYEKKRNTNITTFLIWFDLIWLNIIILIKVAFVFLVIFSFVYFYLYSKLFIKKQLILNHATSPFWMLKTVSFIVW